MNTVTYEDFQNIGLRTGKIVDVQDFPEARKPAYRLVIDFGPEIGLKKSSAQIVLNYKKETLFGKIVVAVTNFPPKQIGPAVSEVLVCGTDDQNGNVTLLTFDHPVQPGQKIY